MHKNISENTGKESGSFIIPDKIQSHSYFKFFN